LIEYDKIFSQIGRDQTSINRVEQEYHVKLPYLSQLCNYLIDTHGGIEFIAHEGKELLIQIINDEFPKIGLYADKIYNEEELEQINHTTYQSISRQKADDCLFNKSKLTLKPYVEQYIILDMIGEFYQKYNIGKILWPCGMGKALLSLFIVQKMGFKQIVIGVPNIYLQKQFRHEISKLYPDMNNVLYIGGESDDGTKSTTDKAQIIDFIYQHPTSILISTYDSCHALVNIHHFDFKIGDEVHHLVGEETESSKYLLFHKILSKKSLFMTATEKDIDPDNKKIIFSMDNKELFGELIDQKSIRWAIEHKKITDYNLLVLQNNSQEVDEIIKRLNIEECNRELIVSAYMALKALETYDGLTHLLIYANDTSHADLLKIYIHKILDAKIVRINKNDVYNNSLHSHNNQQLDSEIGRFSKSPLGIISCVYILGEGFDLPKLNGVVFGECMGSNIRIVQSALRPNRLDKENLNKIAYIIIPMVDQTEDTQSFDKCRKIIMKMGNFDEGINVRIKLATLTTKCCEQSNGTTIHDLASNQLTDNIDELDRLMFKLKHRQGDKEMWVKYKINRENKRRVESNEELIDTKKKCYGFLEKLGESYRPNPINWVKYCVGNRLFIKFKDQYYYNKKDLIDSCRTNNIVDFNSYKEFYVKDTQLPPPDYINEGFYYDMDPKFNLNLLLSHKSDVVDM
jgi:predicted helicase